MRLLSNHHKLHEDIVTYISEIIKLLLYFLAVIVLLGIAMGVYFTGMHVYEHRADDLGILTQTLVVDTVTVLALLEVMRTLLSYLSEGRVRVSLIIDTVMIVTLNEIIKAWYEKGGTHINSLYFIGVTAILMVLRILAIRYGPSKAEKDKAKPQADSATT